MLVILQPGTPEAGTAAVMTRLRMSGLAVHRTEHDGRTRVAAVGDTTAVDWKQVERWPCVESVCPLPRPFKLASRAFRPHDTVISVGQVAIGSPRLAIMAGPCSVEGEEQVFTIARAVAEAGATVLRGGAY
jgi:3-deoxy-7-phosphoheptulonate synthase